MSLKERNKSYLVRTVGNVVEPREKVFVVKAPSRKEAELMASEEFCGQFVVADKNLQMRAYGRNARSIVAIVCLVVSILLSFIPWKVGHDTVLIQPDYISCLFALAFFAVFVVRFKGIRNAVASVIDIVFIVLVTLLLSSFIQAILIKQTIKFMWFAELTIDTRIVLVIAVLFSAFGLKLVSVICMGIVMVFAMINIGSLSSAMGHIWGPVYIVCAFIGMLAYLSIEPSILEAMPYYKNMGRRLSSYVKNDVRQAKQSALNIEQSLKKKKDMETGTIELPDNKPKEEIDDEK